MFFEILRIMFEVLWIVFEVLRVTFNLTFKGDEVTGKCRELHKHSFIVCTYLY
jgi:hypothetical protein